MRPLPRLLVTGASGFLGRFLLDAIKEDYRIIGLARRSQARSGAPVHPNIEWVQVDIGDREPLEAVMRKIAESGGVDVVIHFAAHYDFTGDEHPEYERTNVEGLRNVLEYSRGLGIKHFIFSSSVAACAFPPPGGALTEVSEPDGTHIYARTKRLGEEMVVQYRHDFPATIVRFAAMFSGYCEYAPLFMFLETWLSSAWNARVLGGRGTSAIPYLHVRDAVSFLRTLLDFLPQAEPGEVFIASPDGAVSHNELFRAATRAAFRAPRRALHVPRPLVYPGIVGRDFVGRLTGERPFERPWMAEYVDLAMTIDASRTRQRLGWAPRPRLEILNRMPFLIENRRADPLEWNRRNRAAMKEVRVSDNLRIAWLLARHEDEIAEEFQARLTAPETREKFPSYHRLDLDDMMWNHKLVLRQLMSAVRTGEKTVLTAYCADIAERRFHDGFASKEVCDALEMLNHVCLKVLRRDRESDGLVMQLRDNITMTLRYGCDRAQEVFDHLTDTRAHRTRGGGPE